MKTKFAVQYRYVPRRSLLRKCALLGLMGRYLYQIADNCTVPKEIGKVVDFAPDPRSIGVYKLKHYAGKNVLQKF